MQKLIPIGEAAKFLGVSIDTIRRYDKLGILHSTRPGGKVRFFDIEELNAVKSSKPTATLSSYKLDTTISVNFYKKTLKALTFCVRIIIVALTILTILFLLFPEQTAHFLTSFM